MVFVVKVPGVNSVLVDTSGCRNSGNKVIEIFKSSKNKFSNLDIEEIHLDNSDLVESNKLIFENALEIFGAQPCVFFLGGDHSVSFSLARGFFENCKKSGKDFCLVVFDAHADCMDLWKENATPDHEEWLGALIKSGFPAEKIMLVGARKFHENEVEFLKKNKIKQININSIEEDVDNIADTLMEFSKGKETYVSIDVDVCDPVFAPATGYQEVGGLSSLQLIYLIQRLKKIKTLRGVDIVEIDSEKDKNFDFLTCKLGARILGEFVK